jgi:hypothetical protein
MEGIPTPVNREFGCGKHTSKKYFPVGLPEGDWSDTEIQAGANATVAMLTSWTRAFKVEVAPVSRVQVPVVSVLPGHPRTSRRP